MLLEVMGELVDMDHTNVVLRTILLLLVQILEDRNSLLSLKSNLLFK